MTRDGVEYTCDKCGKTMFAPTDRCSNMNSVRERMTRDWEEVTDDQGRKRDLCPEWSKPLTLYIIHSSPSLNSRPDEAARGLYTEAKLRDTTRKKSETMHLPPAGKGSAEGKRGRRSGSLSE